MQANNTFSLGDMVYGIPNVVLAAEMVIFSAVFWYAYSSTEYSTKARPNYAQLNFSKALLDAINPWDIIKGVLRIPSLLVGTGIGQQSMRRGGLARYGPVQAQAYHHANYSLDGGDAGRMPYGYDQQPYQSPPPFHARDEEQDDSQRHLFADARGPLTPSPRRY